MVYVGTVQNGVVIFPSAIPFPDGTPVRVALLDASSSDSPPLEDDDLCNMTKFASDMGPPDLSVNIDHYLYGHPKVTDGQ